MSVYTFAASMMHMQPEVWRRHANPRSVVTRFSCLPLIVLAIWSRVWIGWWALPLTALALLWTWANPRVFAPPADFGGWGSRVVLGEQMFLTAERALIPEHHRRVANLTSALAAVFSVPLIWGLIVLNPIATVLGMLGTILAKLWFCDRMVWLHIDLTGLPMGTPLPQPPDITTTTKRNTP